MTIQEFSRDIVPILQLIVMVIGLLSLFLLWWQSLQTNQWNKLNSPHNFIDVPLLSKLTQNYNDAFNKLGINPRKNEFTEGETNKIYSDNDAFHAVSAFLNNLENVCAAVSIGCVDEDCAYAVHASGVIRSYYKFSSFINKLRKDFENDEICVELEKIACKWGEKDKCSVRAEKLRNTQLINAKGA